MLHADSGIVARLIDSQARRAIRGYQGNFLAVTKAIEGRWIPQGDEPGVAEHLDALRDYLAATGVAEDDAFLLRFALTVPGMLRGIVPPLLVLEPNRSGFSERRKREAAGQVNRLCEVLALGRVFLTGLNRETSRAVQELAAIAINPPETGELHLLDQIRHLSADQARELAAIALHSLENAAVSVRDLGTDLLKSLACFRFEPLGFEICHALREKAILWPPCLYRDAGDAETQAFLAELDDADDTLRVNHLLLCLAWTRSETAVASIRSWAENPPHWASHLNVPTDDYPPDASWTLNTRGERVELTSLRCHRLRPSDAKAPGAIACRSSIERTCPCCTSPLAVLFDFTSIRADLPKDAPVKPICCLHCSAFAPNFTRYHEDSSFEWVAPEATQPREDEFPFETRYVVREAAECPPFAAANVFEIEDASTIGGVPMWLQDADYPRCPTCAERMRFLAQHDNSAIQEEGLYYAFFCSTCHIAAVNYQQT